MLLLYLCQVFYLPMLKIKIITPSPPFLLLYHFTYLGQGGAPDSARGSENRRRRPRLAAKVRGGDRCQRPGRPGGELPLHPARLPAVKLEYIFIHIWFDFFFNYGFVFI